MTDAGQTPPTVAVCGPAAWNDIIVLDELPEPVPHMQFARAAWSTVGGTSAGKALHLAGLGVPTRLHAMLALDPDGSRVADVVRRAGVDLVAHPSPVTERHVNLMTEAGARVSLYLSAPPAAAVGDVGVIVADLLRADHAVVDLSATGVEVIERLAGEPDRPTVWVDLHDYDGRSAFHEPFLRAADVVFMNADAVDDPVALARSCVERGPVIAVCTLGADGAIAVGSDGEVTRAAAPRVSRVVDTNGAGDAFMAGFLAAHLRGRSLAERLEAASAQAAVALSTRHLHPALDLVLDADAV